MKHFYKIFQSGLYASLDPAAMRLLQNVASMMQYVATRECRSSTRGHPPHTRPATPPTMKLRTSTAPSPTIGALFTPNGIPLANTLHPEASDRDTTVIRVAGDPGDGRTTLALRIATDLALHAGGYTYVVTSSCFADVAAHTDREVMLANDVRSPRPPGCVVVSPYHPRAPQKMLMAARPLGAGDHPAVYVLDVLAYEEDDVPLFLAVCQQAARAGASIVFVANTNSPTYPHDVNIVACAWKLENKYTAWLTKVRYGEKSGEHLTLPKWTPERQQEPAYFRGQRLNMSVKQGRFIATCDELKVSEQGEDEREVLEAAITAINLCLDATEHDV